LLEFDSLGFVPTSKPEKTNNKYHSKLASLYNHYSKDKKSKDATDEVIHDYFKDPNIKKIYEKDLEFAKYMNQKEIGDNQKENYDNQNKNDNNQKENDDDNQKEGSGLKKKRIKISTGKGLSHKPMETFIPFGKHLLHYPKLLSDGEFNLRYASGANHKKFPRSNLSKNYKDFLLDFIDNRKFDNKILQTLPSLDQIHFKNLVRETGLTNQFKPKINHESDEKKDHERFNVLQGEIIAGNNNKQLIDEFKDLLSKFSQTGKLEKQQVKDALKALSNISK
jgi:hypothetical protein